MTQTTYTPEEWDELTEEEILDQNSGLLAMEAANFITPQERRLDIEDLESYSICSVGMIKAIRTFDPTRKTHFATYARRCMRSEMNNWLKLAQHKVGAVHLSAEDGGNMLEVFVEDDTEVIEDTEPTRMRDTLERDRGKLGLGSQEEAVLFGLLQGRTMKSIADELGVTRERVRQRKVEILERLRELYPEGF